MRRLLDLENLTVNIGDKRVLQGLNLHIEKGETHVLLGPNGSGKTSLLMTILGDPRFKVIHGRIRLKDEDITNLPTTDRVKLGLGIAFQYPPSIRGVKLMDMLNICMGRKSEEITEAQFKLAKRLRLDEFLERDVNLGFSGGERKRSEILQLLAQEPDLMMLDEPDSGVDVENMELIGNTLSELLRGQRIPSMRSRAGLIVTHLGYILKYVKADRGHVMLNGRIACSGDPQEILQEIMALGYEGCVKSCLRNQNLH